MRTLGGCLLASLLVANGAAPAAAQETEQAKVPCRDRPCSINVDWTREGGVGNQVPDRRYGNAAQLEVRIKARLTELGFTNHGSTAANDVRIMLMPDVGGAMCDEMAGTATDRSCRAILEIEARVDGPDELRHDIDLPSRIRNRCSSERVMPVDRLGTFVADWIVFALEGRAKGERRPVARC